MDEAQIATLYQQARAWVLEAGALVRDNIHIPLTVDTKSDRKDLVTQVDQEVEYFFVDKIKTHFPSHFLLSEEGYGDRNLDETGVVWVVDPIDGTKNFVHQKKCFAISVGIFVGGIGEIGFIYDVMNYQLYSAKKNEGAFKNNRRLPKLSYQKSLENSLLCMNHHWLMKNRLVDEAYIEQLIRKARGTRAYGSATLAFTAVTEGSIDAYMTMSLEPWDMAAGRILINEVGGKLTNIVGNDITPFEKDSVLLCHPAIHQELLNHYLIPARQKKI
ncbi:MAG TPA: inositol monophosphatase family protein [Pseudogracilibacillus sp.]|nr:inositol monophosphatase family protein [Pseudogracilibacillus sp.]